MIQKSGKVLKSMKPGDPGTKSLVKRFGKRLVCVRYRGNARRRVRSTTVEFVVEEKFWDPRGHKIYKATVSSNRQSR